MQGVFDFSFGEKPPDRLIVSIQEGSFPREQYGMLRCATVVTAPVVSLMHSLRRNTLLCLLCYYLSQAESAYNYTAQ